ncbi:MAG: hypothetical protein L6405_03140 [Actinomycetia bacterium]|nr:hypothetical protein [Actinomycetes bacterium]
MLSPVHSGKPGEMNEEEMYGRFLLSLVDYSDKGGDFSDTIHELREFIRNNFTIDELSTLKSKLDFVVPMPIK